MGSKPLRTCAKCGKSDCACKAVPRESSTKRGYDHLWRQLRAVHLDREPLCRHCLENGITKLATDVDHIQRFRIAGRINEKLRLDPSNLQSLCASCHSKKTWREVRG